MGMAASQARLLFITARLHDVELRAQQLLAAKVQLATQSDAAWEKYNEALDATTLTANALNMQNGTTSTITATFASLTGENAIYGATGDRYGLVKNGHLLLSERNNSKYNKFIEEQPDGDADDFAVYMMGLDLSNADPAAIKAQEQSVFERTKNENLKDKGNNILENLTKWDQENGQAKVDAENEQIRGRNEQKRTQYEAELAAWEAQDEETRGAQPTEPVYEEEKPDYQGKTITNVHDATGLTEEQRAIYEPLINEFSTLAQEEFSDENYEKIVGERAFDEEKYDYYYDMFLQIQSCGGKTEAVDSTKENSSEWLTNMVKNSQIQIYTYDGKERTDKLHFDFEATSPSSDSGISYTNTTEIDKAAQKKAEAEYEHTLKQIDTKEKKIDNELAKLETERNALTTMYDSVKKVIEDNVERTFGIFS